MSTDGQSEHGLKWWVRYVIVPIIGSGGVIAIIVALLNRPPPIPQSPVPSPRVEQLKASSTREILVDFSAVDTHTAPGMTVAAAPYLHKVQLRISVGTLAPKGSELVLINNRALYDGNAMQPTTSQNILTQTGTRNAPASFTLIFAEPLDRVTFTRPALYPATGSGITHPAWSAYGLDAAGRQLSAQSEGIIKSYKDVPARTYVLTAPGFEGIAAVRFDSDPRLDGVPFAAFSALLIERLTLIRRGK